MEKVFGDYLIRCKVEQPPEANNEESKEEQADPDQEVDELVEPFYPFEKISIEDALVRTTTSHVVVLFTAEYCPPCEGFMYRSTDFIKEANKDPSTPKFQVLVVNCDRAEEQYRQHLEKMDPTWLAVPFEAQQVAEKLEDMAQAENIPRVAILNPSKSIDECQVKDIKSIIMRNQNSEAAVNQVMDLLI
eukprot:CAMPEP_0170467236 /NCGR_PEP_ID=MMETSP0123-20130129/10884_1 /TAXON_ID=182087 /ORGANISM="Favella ehrenbergii, Strain Fehren 1" /LENGTH=188 /DNA_ID=CAMNT_0010733539 /DNA_START=12 /DNA_END=578 /DNA_ORIENTATION=+